MILDVGDLVRNILRHRSHSSRGFTFSSLGVESSKLLFLFLGHLFQAQTDLSILIVDANHFDIDNLTDRYNLLGTINLVLGKFGDVQQPFEVFLHLHKCAEIGGLGDSSSHHRSDGVSIGNITNPGVLLHLLETEGNPLAILVDLKNHGMNLLTLLQLLGGVDDLAGPGHVTDMEQTIDAVLQLDECAVIGEVANLSADVVTHRVFLGNDFPGIHFHLLHAQTDLLLVLLDFKDDHINFLILFDDFTRIRNSSCPRHL